MSTRTFITTREREVIEALTPDKRYMMVPTERLECSQSSIDSMLTFVFDKFMDALRTMSNSDYNKPFANRYKKNQDEIMKLTRQIRANARSCSG